MDRQESEWGVSKSAYCEGGVVCCAVVLCVYVDVGAPSNLVCIERQQLMEHRLLFMTYNGWVMLSMAIGAFVGYLVFGGNVSATKEGSCH